MEPLGAEDPQVIGAYRLLGRLGSGGMGRVFVGRSAGGRTVAVKVVHAHFSLDHEFRARFRREVEAARRVGGEWTAPVLDADPDARVPWVATGYVAGPSLSQAIADEGALPEPSVRALGAGLAEALVAVHALGLVHRDVKPSNVLLALDGPRLIDFGIARATQGTVSLTSTGASIGSPGYMAPEQILGKGVDGAADVFSLGAVLAYAATGEPPFLGDSSAALLYKVVHEEARLGRGLTGELRDLVAACLAKDPAARPTPERIVNRLAPDGGASSLVRPGWLPGPLVERVSRRAVELLDLDALAPADPALTPSAPPAPSIPGAPSAPVIPTAPGTPAASAHTPATPLGAFGPPDPSYGGPTQAAAPEDRAPGAPASAEGQPAEGQSAGGRRIAVSAAIGGRNRPKALSCTLVLSIAGALAAATTAAVVFHVLPGTGAGGGKNDASSTKSPGPSATDHAGDSPGRGVPKAFLGTWKGDLTTDFGVPGGELTITIREGKPGDKVGSGRVELAVLRCNSSWTLVSATSTALVLDSRIKETEKHTGCTDGSAEERFTLASDGTLRYKAVDQEGGNPSGTLRKAK
ncbi:putative serine/threonine protein kinase [Streptomyces bingchenggensis BCW-1]|uniref:Putative serine/threonine protein kinase n=2 Tax=Streptomyces TaxID=1883 RepID=D7CI11_STRBB|nr:MULTISPECIES: serine/threonine-protein kinase [Streptomyces]ADI09211.1 putative serine/threonine protein kinase [Streptomyces bingchenggensis BCW-1]